MSPVGFLVGAADVALSLVSIAALFGNKAPDPNEPTTVTLAIGEAPNAGGSVPHIAVWDKNGDRVGQYKGDANGHYDDESTYSITIPHDQNGHKQAQPEYVSIVMHESDAICLTAVLASGDSQQWAWNGDLAATCGAQWYPSKFSIGGSNSPRHCAWLDSDYSNGIIAKGLSLHIRDFAGEEDLVEQYKKDKRRLCQNTARMTFHHNILPDSPIKIFKPPLPYTTGGRLIDGDRTTGGALKDPDQGIDRKTSAYPDGTDLRDLKGKKKKKRAGDSISDTKGVRSNVKGLKNNMPDDLVISHLKGHSAKNVCDSGTSLGPDFISMYEKVFCDMQTGDWWPLCDSTKKYNCFDLVTKTLKFDRGAKRDLEKRGKEGGGYKRVKEWQ
ncbi:hypothetical protein FQN49_008404 [Arthroderma sp. PD_2]|nr:hypothetical protein FQN49_008404 [Arthroderma sp. PD_2]